MNLSPHREMFIGLAICLALCLPPSTHAARITPNADHTIWVEIETVPNGVTLYAAASETGELGPRIGITPCVIAVDLTWGRHWFARRWDRLRLRSPGNACYPILQSDSSYDLFLNLTMVKDGYREQSVDARILTLKYPGNRWREHMLLWPQRTRFATELEPLPTRRESPASPASEPIRRVIMADSQAEGAEGTLTVRANVESAQVLLNGRTAGTTPIEIVLKEGTHLLEIRKPGYHPLHREILVRDDDETAYRAVLKALEP